MDARSRRKRPVLEGYRFQRLLGTGGMGEVWLATDVTLGREVAIKLIRQELADDPAFSNRFFNEMKTVAKFRHPNIGRVYGTGRASDGRLAMIMELLEGKSLRQVIEAQAPDEPFNLVRAAYFTIQVLEALQAAHEQGIQHRDIKPENAIVHEDGHVWLVDFGVATRRQITGEVGNKELAPKQSTLLGTARFMAPELIEHGKSDERSDLYSVGVMLYFLLTREFPHPGIDDDNETGILAAHVHLDPKPISEVREECQGAMEAIVAKLLAKEPNKRFQSAEETITELSTLVRGSLPPSDPIAKKLLQDREKKARQAAYAKHVAQVEASKHAPTRYNQVFGEGAHEPSATGDRHAQTPQPTKPLPPDFVAPSPTSHSAQAWTRSVLERSTVPMGAPSCLSMSSPYFVDNRSGSGGAVAPAECRTASEPTPPGPAMPSGQGGSAAPPTAHAPPLVAAHSPAARLDTPSVTSSGPTGPLPAPPRAPAADARPAAASISSTDPGWERGRPGAAPQRRSPAIVPSHVLQLVAAVSSGVALAAILALVLFRGRSVAGDALPTTADAGATSVPTALASTTANEAPLPSADAVLPATAAAAPAASVAPSGTAAPTALREEQAGPPKLPTQKTAQPEPLFRRPRREPPLVKTKGASPPQQPPVAAPPEPQRAPGRLFGADQ